MKIKADIRVINPVVEGVSNATGMPWRRQDVVLHWMETDVEGKPVDNLAKVSLCDRKISSFQNGDYKVGDIVEGDLRITTQISQSGNVFNKISFY